MDQAKYLMTDAIEGSGIVYWAEARKVTRDSEGFVTSFEVRDGGYEDARTSDKWTKINADVVNRAALSLLLGRCPVQRDIAAQFVGEWEYDSDGVDAIIQCACFGELVFG